MATHLTLLCHGATSAMRDGAFGQATDPLDEGGRAKLARFRLEGPAHDRLMTSAALAARQTADHVGPGAEAEAALADIDAGPWAGRSLADLLVSEPLAASAWLAAPVDGTPGGETMQSVADRLRPWLDRISARDGRVVAVSHAAVLRVAVALVLGAPLGGVLALDIAPLTAVSLSFNRIWRLRDIRSM